MSGAYKYRPQYTQNTVGASPKEETTCPFCHHSLENNPHGFDQNDATVDDEMQLVHSGHCTYCKECREGK